MRALVFAGLCAGALSGCTTPGPMSGGDLPPPSLLPVSSVVNAIKCELAETFIKRPDLRALIVNDPGGADVKASLQLKNVQVLYKSVGGGATIPILGIEIGPSATFSQSDTTGQTFDVDFSYDVQNVEKKPVFCDNPVNLQNMSAAPELAETVKIKDDPFVEMLDGISKQYQQLGAGVPKVKLTSLAYTSSFAVETDVGGGLSGKVIVFSVSAKAGKKTTESQALKMIFGLDLQAVIL